MRDYEGGWVACWGVVCMRGWGTRLGANQQGASPEIYMALSLIWRASANQVIVGWGSDDDANVDAGNEMIMIKPEWLRTILILIFHLQQTYYRPASCFALIDDAFVSWLSHTANPSAVSFGGLAYPLLWLAALPCTHHLKPFAEGCAPSHASETSQEGGIVSPMQLFLAEPTELRPSHPYNNTKNIPSRIPGNYELLLFPDLSLDGVGSFPVRLRAANRHLQEL